MGNPSHFPYRLLDVSSIYNWLHYLSAYYYDFKDTSSNRSRQELQYIAELSRARWSCRLKAKQL
eukprot:scaffold8671_cov112-Skeletonema_dohrnii-CCMP3373.AAC.2